MKSAPQPPARESSLFSPPGKLFAKVARFAGFLLQKETERTVEREASTHQSCQATEILAGNSK